VPSSSSDESPGVRRKSVPADLIQPCAQAVAMQRGKNQLTHTSLVHRFSYGELAPHTMQLVFRIAQTPGALPCLLWSGGLGEWLRARTVQSVAARWRCSRGSPSTTPRIIPAAGNKRGWPVPQSRSTIRPDPARSSADLNAASCNVDLEAVDAHTFLRFTSDLGRLQASRSPFLRASWCSFRSQHPRWYVSRSATRFGLVGEIAVRHRAQCVGGETS
jgi:hypothetical protein